MFYQGFLPKLKYFQHPFLDGDELDPLLIMRKRILRGQIPLHPPQTLPLSEWRLIKKVIARFLLHFSNPSLKVV